MSLLRPPPLTLRAAGPAFVLGCTLLLTGCATRDVPTHYPQQSAAAPDAEPAPELEVTAALEQDPALADTAQDANHAGHQHGSHEGSHGASEKPATQPPASSHEHHHQHGPHHHGH